MSQVEKVEGVVAALSNLKQRSECFEDMHAAQLHRTAASERAMMLPSRSVECRPRAGGGTPIERRRGRRTGRSVLCIGVSTAKLISQTIE